MLTIIKSRTIDLPQVALGAGYSGPENYRDKTTYETSDGTLTIGAWSYEGTFRSDVAGSRHHVWVVIAGTVEVDAEGVSCVAREGDTLVFEAPYGPKHRVAASDDFRAIWLTIGDRGAIAHLPDASSEGTPDDLGDDL